MTYKPVGADENGHFPPRVEARLSADFGTEAVTDIILATLVAGANIVLTPSDATNSVVISSTGGSGGGDVVLVEDPADPGTFIVSPGTGGSGTVDAEAVRDIINTALVAGAGVTITKDDAADATTISATGVTDVEVIRDTIASTVFAGQGITIANNDAANTTVISADPELIRDTIGATLVAGANVSITVDDTANTVTIATTGGAAGVSKDTLVVNVKDHGVVGNNVTDDTAALNAANDYAESLGAGTRLFIPRGLYKITGEVNFTTNLDASTATFVFTGTGNAVSVGDTGVATLRRSFELPAVQRAAIVWNDTGRGVTCYNLNDCQVRIPYVWGFEQGVRIQGQVTGAVYSTYYLGSIINCHRGLILDAASSGWVNQNLFINGRVQAPVASQSLIDSGFIVQDDTHATMLEIGVTAGVAPNNNTFINLSLEGDTPAYYRMNCQGSYNRFINCRWEIGGTPDTPGGDASSRIRWADTARYNFIDGGYQATDLVETIVDGAVGNVIIGHRNPYVSASNTSGAAIPAGTTSDWHTIGGWTNTSVQADYNATTGEWTPRQGRWRASVTLSVITSASQSDVQVRLLAAGARVIDMDNQPAVDGRTWVKLMGSDYFVGNETLEVQVRQDPAARSLAAAGGYNNFDADYLGA